MPSLAAIPRTVRTLVPAAVCAATLALLPGSAEAQGIGYLLEPGASYVRWDDGLGVDDDWLWGGAVSLTFGDLVRLQPFWYQRGEVDVDPTMIEGDDPPFQDVSPFTTDIRHMGANLELDLGRGDFVPFLRVGGGVLRFDPDREDEAGDALDRITLQYGGGLRFTIGRAGLNLWGQGVSFRLDRARLYTPLADPPEGEEQQDWRNLVAGASVQIPLGTRPPPTTGGIIGASAPVEAFAGELRYNDAFDRADQRLVGVRAGFDVNALAGIRGFYWQGVNNDFDGTEDVKGYGGEAQFRLGSGTGLAPFLVAGAGRIDYDPEFTEDDEGEGEPEAAPADRTAVILGGGVALRLSDRIDLTVAARNWLMDTAGEGDLEGVEDPDDLSSNWLYSAGLAVRLGGSTAQGRAERVAERRDAERAELERMREEMERERQELLAELEAERRGAAVWDTVVVRGPEGREERRVVRRAPGTADAVGPERIVIPVLEEGTVYIRFGPGGPGMALMEQTYGEEPILSPDELRALIREELGQEMQEPGVDEARLDELEDRIVQRLTERLGPRLDAPGQAPVQPQAGMPVEVLERIDEMERALTRRIDALVEERLQEQRPPTPAAERAPVPEETDRALYRLRRFDTRASLPYGGVNFGDATQALVGARFDFGPLQPGSPLDLVPEIAIGFGEGDPTLLLLGNVRYNFGGTGGARDLQPYLIGGAGVYSPTVLAINTGIGLSFDLRAGRDTPLRTFAEIQGLNLFDRTRLLVGVSLRP